MQDVFELLKREINARGWNVSRLAEACGSDIALTSRWVAENPERRVVPGPKSCQKIAAALGLDPDYVLELAGHRSPKIDRTPPDPDIAAITAVWPSLDEGIQRAMRILAGVHTVSGPQKSGVSGSGREQTRRKRPQNGGFTHAFPALRFASAAY